MSIRLGIYDFFSYTIPGIFYLLIGLYAAVIFDLVTAPYAAIRDISFIAALVLAGMGYVTGILLDPIARQWHKLFRPKSLTKQAFAEFNEDYPDANPTNEGANRRLLLAYLRKNDREIVVEIERFNAYRIMMANISLGLFSLVIIHCVYYILCDSSIWYLILAGVLLLLSILAGREGAVFGLWFSRYTYIAAYAEVLDANSFFDKAPPAKGSEPSQNIVTDHDEAMGNKEDEQKRRAI